MPMQRKTTIMILPNGERDWIVREDGGRELGHYPTRKEAEAVGRKIAHKRGVELRTAGWFSRLLGR